MILKGEEDGDRHGAGDRHEQAHEPAGRLEDHGGDKEGGGQRGSPSRQLQRSDPGDFSPPRPCYCCHQSGTKCSQRNYAILQDQEKVQYFNISQQNNVAF